MSFLITLLDNLIVKIAYAFPMSVFRKAVYIVCVFVLPLYTGVHNVFLAGSISDFIGAAFTEKSEYVVKIISQQVYCIKSI